MAWLSCHVFIFAPRLQEIAWIFAVCDNEFEVMKEEIIPMSFFKKLKESIASKRNP